MLIGQTIYGGRVTAKAASYPIGTVEIEIEGEPAQDKVSIRLKAKEAADLARAVALALANAVDAEIAEQDKKAAQEIPAE